MLLKRGGVRGGGTRCAAGDCWHNTNQVSGLEEAESEEGIRRMREVRCEVRESNKSRRRRRAAHLNVNQKLFARKGRVNSIKITFFILIFCRLLLLLLLLLPLLPLPFVLDLVLQGGGAQGGAQGNAA